ncbi:MAG: sigma-70 family RNA polymerase sigma factor [Bacteroidia bacterium]|nr:sigma-70 family RNA polymerase sigma factor [Bacteroidia bacterium]
MKMTESYSEKELISGIQRDDQESLRVVYKANFASIAHFVINNSGTEQDAKDVYQEAFIVLYERLRDESFVLNCQIKTFLYSVSRRLWLKRLAEKSRYVGKINDYESIIPLEKEEEPSEDNEQQFEMMQAALEKLGEPCRTILEDFYIRKKSMQKIADKMGYTNMANAKNQKYKCLQRLKKIYFKQFKPANGS